MNSDLMLESWPRPQFEQGDGVAFILYVVYGAFIEDLPISRSKYRTNGIPQGFDLRRITRAQLPELPFTDGEFSRYGRTIAPELFQAIDAVPECLILQGEIKDSPILDYLRDSIGVVSCFLDHGGVAVVDPQTLRFYTPAEWRSDFFNTQIPSLKHHVAILYSDEESGGGRWYHTRGLRKFARPDLSLKNVPPKYEEQALELCNRFIELLAGGGRIAEGQEIRMSSLPSGLACRKGESLDDPDFNNFHVEIQFPID
jgi:hypothetical protein